MTENSIAMITTGITKNAETGKQRRGFFSRIRRRVMGKAERIVSDIETTESLSVVLEKERDTVVGGEETDTTVSDDTESDSEASSSYHKDSRCSVSSLFSTTTNGVNNISGPSYVSEPDKHLHDCLRLLSSKDLDLNRLGLQKLNLLISGRTIKDPYRSEQIASFVLVLGGPLGSMEELLRFVFVTMICDAPQNQCYRTESSIPMIRESLSEEEEAIEEWVLQYDPSQSQDYEDDDEDDDDAESYTHDVRESDKENDDFNYSTHCSRHESCEHDVEHLPHPRSQGKAGGLLHNHALKILANALGDVYAKDPTVLEDMPLDGSLWKSIIMSLAQNIENNNSVNATMYSMKILRFLYCVRPTAILPLLKYSLFANLVTLKDYGEKHGFPMISSGAEKLLEHIRAEPRITKRRITPQNGNRKDNSGISIHKKGGTDSDFKNR